MISLYIKTTTTNFLIQHMTGNRSFARHPTVPGCSEHVQCEWTRVRRGLALPETIFIAQEMEKQGKFRDSRLRSSYDVYRVESFRLLFHNSPLAQKSPRIFKGKFLLTFFLLVQHSGTCWGSIERVGYGLLLVAQGPTEHSRHFKVHAKLVRFTTRIHRLGFCYQRLL